MADQLKHKIMVFHCINSPTESILQARAAAGPSNDVTDVCEEKRPQGPGSGEHTASGGPRDQLPKTHAQPPPSPHLPLTHQKLNPRCLIVGLLK